VVDLKFGPELVVFRVGLGLLADFYFSRVCVISLFVFLGDCSSPLEASCVTSSSMYAGFSYSNLASLSDQ